MNLHMINNLKLTYIPYAFLVGNFNNESFVVEHCIWIRESSMKCKTQMMNEIVKYKINATFRRVKRPMWIITLEIHGLILERSCDQTRKIKPARFNAIERGRTRAYFISVNITILKRLFYFKRSNRVVRNARRRAFESPSV